ncbi:MAG: hypothetical protein ACREC9_05055 [Methylocella sp.]
MMVRHGSTRTHQFTLIDAIGIALIVVGIAMTVLNFLAARQPSADARSVTIRKSGPSVRDPKVPVTEFAPRGAGNIL